MDTVHEETTTDPQETTQRLNPEEADDSTRTSMDTVPRETTSDPQETTQQFNAVPMKSNDFGYPVKRGADGHMDQPASKRMAPPQQDKVRSKRWNSKRVGTNLICHNTSAICSSPQCVYPVASHDWRHQSCIQL